MSDILDLSSYLWPDITNRRQPQSPVILNEDNYLARNLVLALDASQPKRSGVIVPDFSSSLNNASLVNSPPLSNSGYAGWRLNGSDQYLSVPHATSLSPASIGVMALINVSAFNHVYNAIVHKGDGSAYYEYYVTSAGKLAVYLNTSGGYAYYDGNGAHTISTGKWYLVGFSYDQLNGLIGYVNGQLDNIFGSVHSGTLDLTSVPNALSVGNDSYTSDRVFTGDIALVQVYNRNLTGPEFFSLYQNPWQIFAPPVSIPMSIVTAGGGGGTTLDLAVASWDFTPETVQMSATLELSDASVGLTPEDVTLTSTISLGSASFGLTPEDVTIVGGALITLGLASFSIAGQSVTILGSVLISLGVAALSFAGNSVTVKSTIRIGAASLSWAAESITLIRNRLLELGAASFRMVGKSVTLLQSGIAVIATLLLRWRRNGRR